MFMRTMLAILCLGWFVVALPAVPIPDEAKRGPIDPETIAAYEKLGAVYGGFDVSVYGYPEFFPGKEAATKRLPGFQFAKLPAALPKLPPVQVSFGIYLGDGGLRSIWAVELTGLNELKDLKNLDSLYLRHTKTSDAELKVLLDLPSLTKLDLSGTDVTDAGLKALKNLQNLTMLGLSDGKVTDAGLKETQGPPKKPSLT